VLAKIDAERDVVDVAKNRVAAILRHQAIEYAAGDDAGILAAIGDRYASHRPIDGPGLRSGRARPLSRIGAERLKAAARTRGIC
jgi:hypothetical protein